jgi:hypothetical protein
VKPAFSSACLICGAADAPRRVVEYITTNVCDICFSVGPAQVAARLQERLSAADIAK